MHKKVTRVKTNNKRVNNDKKHCNNYFKILNFTSVSGGSTVEIREISPSKILKQDF